MTSYTTKVRLLLGFTALMVAAWVLGGLLGPEGLGAKAEGGRLFVGKVEEARRLELGSPAAGGGVVAPSSGGAAAASTLVLEKEGEAWHLDREGREYPARAERVESFLKELSGISGLTRVASSKEAWEGLGLSEAAGKRVRVLGPGDKALADFVAGGYGPRSGEAYLRKTGRDEAFLASSSYLSYISGSVSGWLDLRLFRGRTFEPKEVQGFRVESRLAFDAPAGAAAGFSYALTRDKAGWKGPGFAEGKPDPLAVEALLRALGNLEGLDFAEADADFGPVQASLSLELGNGSSLVLEVGNSREGGKRLARVQGGDFVYVVGDYSLKNVLKDLR